MGKNIIAASFVILSMVSIIYFFSREEKSSSKDWDNSDKHPRLILEEFTVYRYKAHQVQSTLTGRIAHFIEPNILEVYGDIRGLKHNSPRKEHIAAESASIYFRSHGIVQLMSSSKVDRCEVENNVRIGIDDSLISTQYTQYLGDNHLLRSDVPVVFTGSDSSLTGRGGYTYDINSGELELFGPIEGLLQKNE